MKYSLIILKAIGHEILWGMLIGTCILIVSWFYGYKDILQLTNILFISAGILLFFGPAFFSPKGLGFLPIWLVRGLRESKHEIISGKVEPSSDETLVWLSEEEQKTHLSLESFIVLINFFGIGTTLIFYSLVLYFIFGR